MPVAIDDRAVDGKPREPSGWTGPVSAADLGFAAFFVGGFRPLVVTTLWLRSEGHAGAAAFNERLADYRLMVAVDPYNAGLRAFLISKMAFILPTSEVDPARRLDWLREGLAFGRESVAAMPHSRVVARSLAEAYFVLASHRDPDLTAAVPGAARQALELFERRVTEPDGSVVTVGRGEEVFYATLLAGREALFDGDYDEASRLFGRLDGRAADWKALADACRSGRPDAVELAIEAFGEPADPIHASLDAMLRKRFGRPESR